WHARPAMIAVGPVGKRPAPPKSHPDQLSVDPGIDEMTGRCHLRARRPIRQIAARIRRSRVELQRSQWQIVELGHCASETARATAVQSAGGSGEFTNRESQSANTRRATVRAPK